MSIIKVKDLGILNGSTPAFYAYMSANQTVTNNVNTKAQVNTEVLDTDGCYDNSSNYRFTPTTAGKYVVYAGLVGGTDGYRIYTVRPKIYKNGSSIAETKSVIQDDTYHRVTETISTVVDMNGSSDYVELYGLVDIHANNTELFIGASVHATYFGAYRIIGA